LTVMFFEVENCDLRWTNTAEHWSAGGNGGLGVNITSPSVSGCPYGEASVSQVFYGEPATWSPNNAPLYATGKIGQRSGINGGLAETARHNGGSNFLASDGHVKWLRAEDVSGGFTATSATNAQDTTTTFSSTAAGTGSMMIKGTQATLTFSPL